MSTEIFLPNNSEFLPPDSDMVPSSHAECSSILRVAHRFYKKNLVEIAYHCVHGALKESERIDPLSHRSGVRQFRLSLSIWLDSTLKRYARRNLLPFSLYSLKNYCESYYHDYISPLSGERPLIRFSRSYLTHICQTGLVLFKVLVLLSEDERLPSKILESYAEVKRVADIFRPHNVIPLDPYSENEPIRKLPEVKLYHAKVNSMLEDLQSTFGFQKGNVENQSEHLTWLLANVHLRMYPNEEPPDDPQPPDIQGEALDAVMNKLLDNYIRWYKFLDLKDRRWSPHIEEETDQQRKLQYVGLYLLIWGEAANLRFMPECLCYIYHHMAFELFEKLEKRVNDETGEPKLPAYGDENEAFLMKVVTPIYQTLAMEAKRGAKGKHAEGRNYDDLNEYFWSTECFQLGWPMETTHPFFAQDTGPDRLEVGAPAPNVVPDVKKVNFIERRSFFHIFRSFDRLWVFYILSFQAMIIIAWNEAGGLPAIFEFHYVMSMFSTFAGLEFSRVLINIYLSWDASFKFTCFMNLVLKALCTMFSVLPYFCNYSSYTLFNVLAILCYVSSKLMMWRYQPRLYIGRGMDESTWSYFKYMMFWVVLLFAKFAFNYYAEIRPLVSITKEMMQLQISVYRFPELFSPVMKIIGLVISLWSSVICVYFMDTQIWYAIVSTLVGGLIGFFIRLGEVQTLGVFRTRFQFLPRAFNDLLVPISEPDAPQHVKQTKFCQMWNSIIDCFRKEDLISNWEMELLLMPDWKKLDSSENKEGDPIRWPVYLVASKIPIAINMAKGRHGEVGELTERLNADIYMNSAVKECYASFKFLVTALVSVKPDKDIINHIFNKIDDHIERGTLLRSVNWSSLPLLLENFVKLIGYFVNRTRGWSEESKTEFEKIPFILLSMLDILRNNMMIEDLQGMDVRTGCFTILNLCVHIRRDWEKNIKRLYRLLTLKESDMDVPSNLEARRRLMFFSNSLFMKMPNAPKFNSLLSYSALTPYYSEDVFFSSLEKKNDDGISILFYLQKIFPDEWTNFLQRVECDSKKADRDENRFEKELCLWASYRGQTVARTVRGIMYYQKALKLQGFWDLATNEEKGTAMLEIHQQLENHYGRNHPRADMKFSYVLSCQQYSIHKKSGDSRAKDIQMLMNMYPELRVAYIDEDAPNKDGTDGKFYYSALVKADPEDREKDLCLELLTELIHLSAAPV